jgi:hypothetical protein
MANNIKPEISLGVKGPQAMTLGELVGTATKAMEFSKLSELYPELINKARAESQTTQMGLEERRLSAITSGMTSMINNPIVVAAEQDPNSIDPQKLLGYVTEHGYNQAKMLGIPREKADVLMAPYLKLATENPGQLRNYAKERLLAGLDTASRVSTLGGTNPMGVSTIPPNQPAFRRPGVTPEAMTAPLRGPVQGQNLMVAPVTENQVGISAIQGGAPTTQIAPAPAPAPTPVPAQASIPVGQMVQPETTNYPLMFEPPTRAGINRPKREGEDKAIEFGTTLRGNLAKRQLELTKSRNDLDEVIRTATKIKQDAILPETGLIGAGKRRIYETIGDPTYQKLRKDIANVLTSNQNALSVGGNSVAGLELTKEAAGDITYDPTVIVDIARRAKADLTNLDMMATGIQKHFQRYGDANAQRFTQMWSANADSKIFQIMDINRDITDPKLRQAAAAKVMEGMSQAQREALDQKYKRIVRLTNTGDIAQ